ncbi:MAG: NADH-quinone oxidoreductase subunit NuoE [Deltaproteobacteria bacterium]|jgi:NADH-quinone oxidoreductase subunit E|nr:NADH-quinone oxidoreductase subunit NuoE [Deltaproteobacteria bacterium]
MTMKKESNRDFIETANNAVEIYHGKKEELIPILMKVNQDIGFIPKEAMEQISSRMKIPPSQLYSVASFYHMFYTKETGRHIIKFCESAPCHVVGSKNIVETLKKELQIEPGETSSDKKWTLVATSCLGVCAEGPVIMIDEDLYGNLTPNQIPDILAKYE